MDSQDLQRLRMAINRLVNIGDSEWAMLVPYLFYRQLKKGENWITEGEKEKQVGFVLSGNLRHYYTHDGEEKTTYFYFEDHLVSGYFSALSSNPSKLTIQALSDCRLLVFTYSVLLKLFDASQVWERFGRKLAEYLVMGLEERMVELLILSPEERYLRLIAGNKTKIIERIPQHLIASFLGVNAVSLSRIRNRIVKK